MAQIFVTGPCALWVGTGPNHAAQFLGHSEGGFTIEARPQYEYVMNDITGSKLPLDVQDMGEEHLVQGTLTRWNQSVFERWAAHPRLGGVAGTNVAGDRGLLLLLEGGVCPIWLVFPYSQKPAMQNAVSGGLPAGRRYPFPTIMPYSWKPLGTKASKRDVGFHCLPALNPVNGNLVTYDSNMSGTSFAIPN